MIYSQCFLFRRQLAETSPYMEVMRQADAEVLFCFENYDELVLMQLGQFDKKLLKSIENEVSDEKTGKEKHEETIDSAGTEMYHFILHNTTSILCVKKVKHIFI